MSLHRPSRKLLHEDYYTRKRNARRNNQSSIDILNGSAASNNSQKNTVQRNYAKENMKKIKEIQANSRLKQKQTNQPLKALWRDSKYENITSKVASSLKGTSPSKDFHISTELESSAKIDSCGKDQNHIRKRSSSLSKINDKKSPTKYSTTNKSREYLVKGNESRNRHTVQSEASKEDSNNIKKVSSPGKNKMFLPKYLIQRKKEIEEERTRQQSKIADQNVPFGQKLVSEAEKQEMLSLLQIKYNLLCKELRELSITNDTLRIKQKHKELEDKIVDVEKGINIFSRKTVYIKNE